MFHRELQNRTFAFALYTINQSSKTHIKFIKRDVLFLLLVPKKIRIAPFLFSGYQYSLSIAVYLLYDSFISMVSAQEENRFSACVTPPPLQSKPKEEGGQGKKREKPRMLLHSWKLSDGCDLYNGVFDSLQNSTFVIVFFNFSLMPSFLGFCLAQRLASSHFTQQGLSYHAYSYVLSL